MKSQYLGLDIQDALALAHKNGDQLRVMMRKHSGASQHMRYAFPPEAHEICVDVVDNKVTRVL